MSTEAITRLRELFEAELSANPSLYHPIDINRVRTEDWQVARFLLDQPDQNETKAFEALCESLQWKHSFGVHTRTDSYYPKELWELNDIEIYGQDRAGRLIQWGSIRNKRSFKQINLLAKQFVAHTLERADRAAGENGFIIISDTNGGGLANVDLEMNKFNQAILQYYPQSLKAMYILDLPWLLNSIMKFMMSFVDPRLRRTVHFLKSTELVEHVEAKYIHRDLGGQREKKIFPAGLVPLDQCYKRFDGVDEDFVGYFYKLYKLKRSDEL